MLRTRDDGNNNNKRQKQKTTTPTTTVNQQSGGYIPSGNRTNYNTKRRQELDFALEQEIMNMCVTCGCSIY